jgi:beta-phosphoglucomutase-like phosphatase (HAD superfamily)
VVKAPRGGKGFFSPFKGAVFDLDGTLADSMGLWEEVDRLWLEKRGIKTSEHLAEVLKPMSLTEAAEYVIRRFGVGPGPGGIIQEWQDLALEQYRSSVALKEGAGELIRLFARRGMKLAIATSCFPAACETFLARQGLRKTFSALVYTDEVRSEEGRVLNKGFPQIWRTAAERMGLAPEDCVMFEDLYEALKGGRAAGMGVVAVWDPRCPDWSLMEAGADLALRSLKEAPAFC